MSSTLSDLTSVENLTIFLALESYDVAVQLITGALSVFKKLKKLHLTMNELGNWKPYSVSVFERIDLLLEPKGKLIIFNDQFIIPRNYRFDYIWEDTDGGLLKRKE